MRTAVRSMRQTRKGAWDLPLSFSSIQDGEFSDFDNNNPAPSLFDLPLSAHMYGICEKGYPSSLLNALEGRCSRQSQNNHISSLPFQCTDALHFCLTNPVFSFCFYLFEFLEQLKAIGDEIINFYSGAMQFCSLFAVVYITTSLVVCSSLRTSENSNFDNMIVL